MNNAFRFTTTGIVTGIGVGLVVSLVSGDVLIAIMIGALGLIVGDIFGMVHRKGT